MTTSRQLGLGNWKFGKGNKEQGTRNKNKVRGKWNLEIRNAKFGNLEVG
jgi:hypothetical protein